MGIQEEEKLIEETTLSTKAALEKIVCARSGVVPKHPSESKFFKYKPSQHATTKFNSGAKERTIRMMEMQTDPLHPPKFKHKRIPKASGSPPVPITHSPTRPVTVKDQQVWKIPPCVSNWKNPKGYTIPLEKRLACDGRGFQDVQINDKFAKFSEALYVSEQKSREILKTRAKVQKEMAVLEKERKVQEVRELAAKARLERASAVPVTCNTDKSKVIDRDVTEKIALGMASASVQGYDERLFNQDKGMRFATEDDQYNVYDKALFSSQSTLYRPKKDADSDVYGGEAEDQLKKINNTCRFKPDRAFSGTSEKKVCGKRERPIEFDKDEADLFELGLFSDRVMKGTQQRKGYSLV